MGAHTLLTDVWAALIAFAVFGYLVMDGFDLGIGMLSPLFAAEQERPVLMNSIAPIWDGNETWLVFGGTALMAVFPLAYAVLLPALYAPLVAMLVGLIFRGVAFEFRWRTQRRRSFWDAGFFAGSALAAAMQGIALGAILQGIHVSARQYAGGWWDWLSPFSVLAAASLMVGYAALGATWLIWKTEGDLQQRAFMLARRCVTGLIAGMLAVSAATPFLQYRYYRRWFAWPAVLGTAQVPLLVVIVSALLFLALHRRWQRAPFLLTLGLFALSYLGLAISVYPYLVPGSITFMDAAAPLSTQEFLLAGAAILLPIIVAYTGYAYWVFRGKVGSEGYH